MEQQNAIKHIESEVMAMVDRIDALKDAISRTEDQLRALQARIESDPPKDTDGVRVFLTDAQRMMGNITSYEQEIKRIRKDAEDRSHQQQDVKLRAAKAKAEFDKLKVEYDVEYKEKMTQLEALRAAAQERAAGIEPGYMERYKTIKQHSVPPLAKLNNDQCGGCNMSLPSTVLRNIKAGKVVECENCGRLII